MRLWHCKCENFSSRAKRDDRQNEAGESLSGSDGARNPHRDRERSPAFCFALPSLGAGLTGRASSVGSSACVGPAAGRLAGALQAVPPRCGVPPPAVSIDTTPEAACP
jgi:hypothetical protein